MTCSLWAQLAPVTVLGSPIVLRDTGIDHHGILRRVRIPAVDSRPEAA